MESLWSYLPIIAVLACPVGMALMMWFMGRSNGQGMCGMKMQKQVRALEASALLGEKQSEHVRSL